MHVLRLRQEEDVHRLSTRGERKEETRKRESKLPHMDKLELNVGEAEGLFGNPCKTRRTQETRKKVPHTTHCLRYKETEVNRENRKC